MMKILHISAECYPIAKVGGLADVVGALPKYQNSKTVISQVIMPFYDNKFTKENKYSEEFKENNLEVVGDARFELATPWTQTKCATKLR